MAVRQYVGARYVPKFYQNSQNPLSSEWEGNKAYEALTIVTYNNSSYTSKIPVPAGIGNPASNPTYWVATGNYNAQVEQYRQDTEQVKTDIQSLNSDLEAEIQNRKDAETQLTNDVNTAINNVSGTAKKLTNRHFILTGDSYLVGNTPTGIIDSWGKYVTDLLGSDVDVKQFGFGGAGFCAHNGEYTYLTGLQSIADQITNKDEITDIILLGGANDWQPSYTEDAIIEAEHEYLDYCKTTYPNAIVHVGMIGQYFYGNSHFYIRKVYKAYLNGTNRPNSVFIKGINNVLANKKLISSDGLHPTAEGQKAVGDALFNYIQHGEVTVLQPMSAAKLVLEGINDNPTFGFRIETGIVDDMAVIHMQGAIIFTNAVTFAANSGVLSNVLGLKLGTIDESVLWGYEDGNKVTEIPVTLQASTNDSQSIIGFGKLTFDSGEVYLGFQYATGGASTDLTNVIQVNVPSCTVSIPILYC